MPTTSITVTWVTSIVEISGITKYRLVTSAATPVNFKDAYIFLMEEHGTSDSYLHVCTVGDMMYYGFLTSQTAPPIRRVVFQASGYTNAQSGDIGATVVGTNCNGVLRSYDNSTRTWVIAPAASSDVFPAGNAVTVSGSSPPRGGTVYSSAVDDKYRIDSATQDFDSPQDALDEKSLQITRITNLITDWASSYSTFAGTTTETISHA